MRVGVISGGSPDYHIDIVTDGLIRLLGRGGVSLDYNARRRPGGLHAQLLEGFEGPEPFDIHDAQMLVASTRSVEAMVQWMWRTGRKAVALLDGEDHDHIQFGVLDHVRVYFKREYLKDRAYPPKVRPLPLAAIPEPVVEHKWIKNNVFFSGHKTHAFRADVVSAMWSMGHRHTPIQEKTQYNQALMESLVGVAVRGVGWDTYRYWEIPYFGAAMLAQRPGIVIPEDFVDGQEAVFYDGITDFKDKLRWMLADPIRSLEIGRAGHEASLARHLSVHRATIVLDALS